MTTGPCPGPPAPQESSTILNETSPRWGDKFDFVLIPAASSELHIEVYNKTGAFGNLMGAIFRKSKDVSGGSCERGAQGGRRDSPCSEGIGWQELHICCISGWRTAVQQWRRAELQCAE